MNVRRVVKRRPASLSADEWLQLCRRGALPRPDWVPIDDRPYPPVDVYDLVLARNLVDLAWRVEQLMCAMLRPATSTPLNGSSASNVSRCELLSAFSELWEFLTTNKYADGTARLTGQLSVKLVSGGLQVTLTDPTSATYCSLTATSLQDAFLSLEIGLKDGTLAWRASGYAKPKK